MRLRFKLIRLLFISSLLIVGGCEQGSEEKNLSDNNPEIIATGDTCHVCGMAIVQFAGPKGQAKLLMNKRFFKFCSTAELFSWYLQPENTHNTQALFVHDMAGQSWDNPHQASMVDARTAYYVIGSSLKGAMGPSLASFEQRQAAEAFVKIHGGKVIGFSDISLARLAEGY